MTDIEDELIMRKPREHKYKEPAEVKVDDDEDPEDKIAELLNDPAKFKAMMDNMGMDAEKMKNVMRDVTSNPETMRAARDMMGASNDEDLKNKLRKSMSKNGKAPSMKEMRKKQKEYKKIMNSVGKQKVDDSPTVDCVKINRNRQLSIVKVKVNEDGKLPIPKSSQPGFEIFGKVGVLYDPTKVNCENRVIKRIFGRNFGSEVTIYSLDSKPLKADEKELKELAKYVEPVEESLKCIVEEYVDEE